VSGSSGPKGGKTRIGKEVRKVEKEKGESDTKQQRKEKGGSGVGLL